MGYIKGIYFNFTLNPLHTFVCETTLINLKHLIDPLKLK